MKYCPKAGVRMKVKHLYNFFPECVIVDDDLKYVGGWDTPLPASMILSDHVWMVLPIKINKRVRKQIEDSYDRN